MNKAIIKIPASSINEDKSNTEEEIWDAINKWAGMDDLVIHKVILDTRQIVPKNRPRTKMVDYSYDFTSSKYLSAPVDQFDIETSAIIYYSYALPPRDGVRL